MHMWVVLVDGVYKNWRGSRNIVHFCSDDGITWRYLSNAKLSSNRVIDPTVYWAGGTWRMVYKDEAMAELEMGMDGIVFCDRNKYKTPTDK